MVGFPPGHPPPDKRRNSTQEGRSLQDVTVLVANKIRILDIFRRDLQTYERSKPTNKIVTFMWYCTDMFHYMSKAEFVTLVSLKVPSGH